MKNRNCHNFLGPRTLPFWVYVRSGAALDMREANQFGSLSSRPYAKIQLDTGSMLYHCTNSVSDSKITSGFSIDTIRFNGGTFVNGDLAYVSDNNSTAGQKIAMRVFDTLWFSGPTPHAFGFDEGTYAGYKHYSKGNASTGTFKGYFVQTVADSTLELRVDKITPGAGDVDLYFSGNPLFWQTNASVRSRCELVKTGPGKMTVVNIAWGTNGSGYNDFTVAEGTLEFTQQAHFLSDPSLPMQTLCVSNGATCLMSMRNVVQGTLHVRPNAQIIIDHATLQFIPASSNNHGCQRALRWTFNDATLDLRSKGMSRNYAGVLCFLEKATFKGTKPYVIAPCPDYESTHQVINVGNKPICEIEVDDITGDCRSDVTFGMAVYNCATNTSALDQQTDSGIRKTGPGTLSLASTDNAVTGEIAVDAGTLRVDGVLTTAAAVNVAAGAYLGGTGTVANVTLAENAGFDIDLSDSAQANLLIRNGLALPQTAVVKLSTANGDGVVTKRTFAEVEGALTGSTDAWTVVVDGVVNHSGVVSVTDGPSNRRILEVKLKRGMAVIIK
ncbi:MAG TPA: autotransporter-associated beta strand repeat-containing protein [Kiritimatiellia bacterium]|nr:autotransporter-associated beta strand repeat-containing protein [Kiritimatiellia bacterium]HRU69653.1 autotransporter-associated beta strand repeat-containing protein [Kiritimatiellia bacterium]